jgi:DNA-binding transcriptional MerR regulator
MPPSENLDIGEAARRLGVSAATLRLYERRGLLPKARRTAAGYRQYSIDDLHRARLVRRARRVGLSLREIAEAIAGEAGDGGVRRLLHEHVIRIAREESRIARVRRHLQRWLAQPDG